MNLYDLFFWAPFGILAAAALVYVGVSLPYWFGAEQRTAPAGDRKKTLLEAIEELRQLVIGNTRLP